MKDKVFLALGLFLLGWSFYQVWNQPSNISSGVILEIGEETFIVEIADNDEERVRGLSLREPIEANRGMLFIFDVSGNYSFWMKDMLFALDIIWINEGKRVVGIEKGIEPGTFPNKFYPPEPIKYALEIPAGNSAIEIGDMLQFKE